MPTRQLTPEEIRRNKEEARKEEEKAREEIRGATERERIKNEVIPPFNITPESSTGVRFNRDSVDVVSRSGTGQVSEPTRLTREEYENFLSRGGGNRRAVEPSLLKNPQDARINELVKRLFTLRQSRMMQQMQPQQRQPMIQDAQAAFLKADVEIPSIQKLRGDILQKQQAEAAPEFFGLEGAKGDILGKPFQQFDAEQAKQTNQAIIAAGINNFFTIKEAMRGLFGDTQSVKDARKNFNAATGLLQDLNKKVATGEVDVHRAVYALNAAEKEIIQLESSTKKKSLKNVPYWSQQGKDLEEEIANYKEILEGLREDLVNARAANVLANTQEQQLTRELNQAMEGL